MLWILPLFTFDHWCIALDLNHAGTKNDCEPSIYPNSNIPKIEPTYISIVYLVSYFILGVFVIMRLFTKKRTRSALCRTYAILLILAISIIDQIVLITDPTKQLSALTDTINVIIVVTFVRAIREVWMQVFRVIMATLPVFFVILSYVFIFSYIGTILLGQY